MSAPQPSALSDDQVRAFAQHPGSPEGEHLAINLSHKMNVAIRAFGMIEAGDRIAVGVSGGKDSLTLLDLLVRSQRTARDRYELAAVHVASDVPCGGCLDRAQLALLCSAYGVPLEAADITVSLGPDGQPAPLTCFWCSFSRRKALFEAAHRLGCNKVALAHHQDDVAHTAMLNLFRHGHVEGLQPVRPMFGGMLTLIRPLWLVEERRIVRFARARGLPAQTNRCPNAATSERERMRQALALIEKGCPRARTNLLRALGILQRKASRD